MFDFEIIGGVAGQYAAIAFGTTHAMQDADMYYCTEKQLFSGAIRNKEKRPFISNSIPVSVLLCTFLALWKSNVYNI